MPPNVEKAYPGTEYRPDIDGLRAIAVLAVIGFHAQVVQLSWGFVGVDVFFVISGFLISSIVYRSLDRGTFTLRDFYARRINRIFPALLIVLSGCLAMGWTLLVSGEFSSLGKHVVAGAAFISNFVLSAEAGYFATVEKPLVHLWSLAVEEQFYLFFPAVAVIAWKAGRRMRVVLLVLVTLSFGASVWSASFGSRVTLFYYPTTRIWEILAGALLCDLLYKGNPFGPALNLTRRRLAENAASVAGMALLVASIFVRRSTAWPGIAASVPVVGTVLLVAAGSGAFINKHILSRPVLVGVGLISYPLYLWHLPLLVFARIVLGQERPVFPVRASLVILSFVLAWLTYRYVEIPIRFGTRKRQSAARLMILMVAMGFLGLLVWQRRIDPRVAPSLTAAIEAARTDYEFPSHGGFFGRGPGIVVHDILGDSARTILFIGDSHAEQYWPRMVELAESSAAPLGRIRFMTYAGCSNLPGVERRGIAHHGGPFRCDEFYRRAMDVAGSRDVATVVLSTWWEAQVDGNRYLKRTGERLYERTPGTEEAYATMTRDVRRLVSSGKRVFVVLSNPAGPEFNPATLLPSRIPFVEKRIELSVPTSGHFIRSGWAVDRLRRMAEETGAAVIDPAREQCTAVSCARAGPDSLPMYKDDNHYRSRFVRQRALFIDRVVREQE